MSCKKVFSGESIERPSDRFFKYLNPSYEKTSEAKTVEEYLDLVMQKQTRTSFFNLLSLSRVYESISKGKNKSRFSELTETFNSIETQISKYDLTLDLVKKAEEAQLPEEFVKYLRAQSEIQRKIFHNFLISENWYSGEAFLNASKKLDKVNWSSLKKDRELVVKGINEYIETTLAEALTSMPPLHEPKVLDHTSIENALKLREDLRWLRAYLLTARDLFGVTPMSSVNRGLLTTKENSLVEKYKNSGHLDMPEWSGPGMIMIPRVPMYRLIDFVNSLGNVSKLAEYESELSQLYLQFKETKGEDIKEYDGTVFVKSRIYKNTNDSFEIERAVVSINAELEKNQPTLDTIAIQEALLSESQKEPSPK